MPSRYNTLVFYCLMTLDAIGMLYLAWWFSAR